MLEVISVEVLAEGGGNAVGVPTREARGGTFGGCCSKSVNGSLHLGSLGRRETVRFGNAHTCTGTGSLTVPSGYLLITASEQLAEALVVDRQVAGDRAQRLASVPSLDGGCQLLGTQFLLCHA